MKNHVKLIKLSLDLKAMDMLRSGQISREKYNQILRENEKVLGRNNVKRGA